MKDKDFVVDPHRKRQEREDVLTGIMNPCEKADQNRLACEGFTWNKVKTSESYFIPHSMAKPPPSRKDRTYRPRCVVSER